MRVRIAAVLASALGLALVLVAPAQATFPGANGKIAFVRDGDIWTTKPDGSNQVDITNTPSAREESPSWSSDGRQIAYVRDGAIWIMNADGSGQKEVVPRPSADATICGGAPALFLETYLGGPAWSPDGSKIAFHDFRRCWYESEFHDFDLYTVNTDGTERALVTRGGADPRWSPDGTKIGFTGVCGGGGCTDVRWIMPDGSQEQIVYQTGIGADTFFDWSPDGTLMDGCGEDAGGFYCFTVRPDGTGFTRLPSGVVAGLWSPDGTKFLLGAARFSVAVYTENMDGTGLTKIADGGDADWQPLVGLRRSDFKNSARFCKAEREFVGDARFKEKYGGGANAHGKCVSAK